MIEVDLGALGTRDAAYCRASFENGEATFEGTPRRLFGVKLSARSEYGNEGIFAEWAWDGESLEIINDRFGIYPLFVYHRAGEIRVSDSIERLLASGADPALDYEALSVILRIGHCIGNDTPFRHIRAISPNTRLLWRHGKLAEENGPTIRCKTGDSPPFDEAVDGFIELFERAMTKRLPGDERFTVPLSGGRDSRHILLALNKLGFKPAACPTLAYRPPATNEDMQIAGRLAAALGIQHVQIDCPASWFDAVKKDVHLTHFCGGGHSWSLPLAAYLRENVTAVYDGLAGSVISGGFKQSESAIDLARQGRYPELAELLIDDAGKEGFNNRVLLRPFYERTNRGTAVERIAAELKRHEGTDNPLFSFIFWNRTRRMVGMIPYAIMADVPAVHCPYLDHELFDFLTGLDPSYFLGNRFHDAAIHRAYPEFAGIPFDSKTPSGALDADARGYYRQSTKKFFRYILGRSARKSGMVNLSYLAMRSGYDIVRKNNSLPWYLMSSVHLLELEDACSGP